jgi:hypothetical protein
MSKPQIFTAFDAASLAEAFPATLRGEAIQAAERVLRHLHERQWSDFFQVTVGVETVSIPYRLHFSSDLPSDGETGIIYLMEKCLEARSNDGFQRQRAVQQLLRDVQPWSAPFIMAVIGEYLIEILRDINDALTPQASAALADFICANPRYWHLTRQRVVSYWDVYYRAQFGRSEYIGFKLLGTLAEAVRSRR